MVKCTSLSLSVVLSTIRFRLHRASRFAISYCLSYIRYRCCHVCFPLAIVCLLWSDVRLLSSVIFSAVIRLYLCCHPSLSLLSSVILSPVTCHLFSCFTARCLLDVICRLPAVLRVLSAIIRHLPATESSVICQMPSVVCLLSSVVCRMSYPYVICHPICC
jgi:hypothetical protein